MSVSGDRTGAEPPRANDAGTGGDALAPDSAGARAGGDALAPDSAGARAGGEALAPDSVGAPLGGDAGPHDAAGAPVERRAGAVGRLPAALRPLARVYDALDDIWARLMHGRTLGFTLAAVFLLTLALVELNRLGLLPGLLAGRLPTRHFSAVVTAFSLLLIFEVLALVFTLPQSVANSVGRQFELLSLILLREAFLEFGSFGEPIDIAQDGYRSLTVVLADLTAALLVFLLVGIYYKLQRHQRITPDEREQASFIGAKKVIALCLFLGFVALAAAAAVRQLRGQAMFDLFGDFFTILIFADVLVVLVSLAFSSGYQVVFRNSGFAAAAVLIRMALTSPGLVGAALGVGAAVFALALTAAYNFFAPAMRQRA